MRDRLANFALLLVSSLLGLATVEGVARWLLPPPQTVHVRRALNEENRRELENDERFQIKVAENPEEARYCQMLWMKVVCPWRDGAAEESVSGRPWLISMRLF